MGNKELTLSPGDGAQQPIFQEGRKNILALLGKKGGKPYK